MSHLLAVLDSAVLTTQCHYIGNYGGQSPVLMTQCHYIGNSGGQSAIITTQCHDIGDSCGQIVIFPLAPGVLDWDLGHLVSIWIVMVGDGSSQEGKNSSK